MHRKPPQALSITDARVLGEKMGRAFQNDPVCAYIFPDAEDRARRARHFYEFVIRTAIFNGEAAAPTAALEGVACWLKTAPGTLQYVLAGALVMLSRAGAAKFLRLERVGQALAERRTRFASFPHYYLSLFGVAPEHQKTGVGGALLAAYLERFDQERMPAYLDTHNPVNPGYYERFGFRVVDESQIPGTGLVQWSMLRRPV